MPFRQWLRSPRRLLGLFLAIMLTLGAALGWLSWRLLEQDRELGNQRIRERLEGAADLAEAVLVRRLSEAEDRLGLLMSATDPTARSSPLLPRCTGRQECCGERVRRRRGP